MDRASIPRAIWFIGMTSLFMDISSELIHSLLPTFMVSVLGVSAMTVGLVEGLAEATANVTKVFSGALSDYFQRRKPMAVAGYGLAALSKLLFPLATSIGWVIAARELDRLGKGLRDSPRDALLAALTPKGMEGAAFGLRQSLDTIGAVVGPLLAIILMKLLADNLRLVLWLAVIPAVISVLCLAFGVHEPEKARVGGHALTRCRELRSDASHVFTGRPSFSPQS